MTRKECLAILGLKEGASLADIKQAYRRLAFSLHPDLNPHQTDAAKKFQQLNEAYVSLSQQAQYSHAAREQKDEKTQKAREEAQKAYSKAQDSFDEEKQEKKRTKEDILKDILADPFARRVFQDIYSHLKKEDPNATTTASTPEDTNAKATKTPRSSRPQVKRKQTEKAKNTLFSKMSSWMRRQIDEEQTIQLPKDSLTPGARIRLEIRHGLSGKAQTIELTIPPNFNPQKAIRLKGLGRRLGSWRGDLFIRIDPV